MELLTLAGCSFCGVCGNSCPSSVILSLSQGKNQRLDFNKVILFTLNVYCAIETFLHIPDVSIGNFVQLCHWIFYYLRLNRGGQDLESSAFLLCQLVSKFIWLPIILSAGKIKKLKQNYLCCHIKEKQPSRGV